MYALFRAVRDGRTVVYASAKSGEFLVFEGGAVHEVNSLRDHYARQVLAKPETVLICDSMIPPVYPAFTLLVTSPRKDRWHEFNKEMDCTMLFFPVFTLDEIRACRDKCFPGVDDAGMLSRFARWGGIPRYVLAKLKAADQQQLEDAVNSTTLDSVIEHSGAPYQQTTSLLFSCPRRSNGGKQQQLTWRCRLSPQGPGLLGLVQALRLSSGPIRFYWLLPEDVYPGVTRACSFSVDGKAAKLPNMCTEHAAVARRVEQYALCVRLQPESGKAAGGEAGVAAGAPGAHR
jgi:hypothetical protein